MNSIRQDLQKRHQELLGVVDSWLKSMPSGLVKLHQETSDFKYTITLSSQNPDTAKLTLTVDEADKYIFSVGEGMQVELSYEKAFLIELLNATKNGQFVEVVKINRGKLISSKGTIILSSGEKWTSYASNPLQWLLSLFSTSTQVQKRHYAPW